MSARDGHLGDLAAALVDGALDGDARDRALGHITGCTDCRTEVDQQRQLKARLRRRSDPSLPTGLTDRLCAIDQPPDSDRRGAVAPPPSSSKAGKPVPLPVRLAGPRTPAWEGARRPGGATRRLPAPARTLGRRSRRLRRVTGGVTALALGVTAALTLGTLRDQEPAVSPAVGRYTVEHARTTGGVPGADPGAGAVMTVSVNR